MAREVRRKTSRDFHTPCVVQVGCRTLNNRSRNARPWMLEQRSIRRQTKAGVTVIPRTEKLDIREREGKEESADAYDKHVS